MRWIPFETWRWESRLSAVELRDRITTYSSGSGSRKVELVGSITDNAFQLTSSIWGQTSFLPRVIGRWQETEQGTRIDIDIAPDVALQLCLVILFAFFGILVYDSLIDRVIVTTCASTFLAWIWLLVPHEVGAGIAERRLKSLIEPTAAKNDAPPLIMLPKSRILLAISWSGVTVVILVGFYLLRQIYCGVFTLTMRPAVDMITVYWTAQSLVVVWLFWFSGIRPRIQTECLFLFFAMEIAWIWCMVVDGFAGDGRPILAYRWSRAHASQARSEAESPKQASRVNVDLSSTGPDDFPEFRGPRRDGRVHGRQIDPDWVNSPPRIVWKQPIGIGWSAFSIVGNYAVTQEQHGKHEVVTCYEWNTGRQCWEHHDEAFFHEMMGGDGPRATPTIHEGKVYSLGATGILNCLDGQTGQSIWSVNVVTDNQAPTILFGMTGSPLIWHNLVIVAPGGPNRSLVAYDRTSGRRVWGAGDGAAAYASPQIANIQSTDHVFCFNAEGLYAHDPSNGSILWSLPWVTPPERNNVCQPIVWIDENGNETVFIASGYGKGCALLDVSRSGTEFVVTMRWQSTQFQAKFASAVLKEDFVYGLDNNILCCLDLRTGKRRWKGGRYGYGQLLLVESHLLVLSEDGEIVLCDASPDEHRERARFPVLNGRTWNHLALTGRHLLIRNDLAAACVWLPFH